MSAKNLDNKGGTVLYLALEEITADYRSVFTECSERRQRLIFSVALKSLNEGLIDQFSTFLNEYPDTSLIIIDTLRKVREAEGDTYSYTRDYDIIAGLKAFADRIGICLIPVHHTRKQKSDDNFDRILGTNGLLGAADGAFIMYKSKRTDGDSTIEVSGRDQPDKYFLLSRNKETLCRDFKGKRSPDYTEPLEKVKIAEIESIEAKGSMFDKKVTLSKEDYNKLNDTAKKYVAMEKSTKKI